MRGRVLHKSWGACADKSQRSLGGQACFRKVSNFTWNRSGAFSCTPVVVGGFSVVCLSLVVLRESKKHQKIVYFLLKKRPKSDERAKVRILLTVCWFSRVCSSWVYLFYTFRNAAMDRMWPFIFSFTALFRHPSKSVLSVHSALFNVDFSLLLFCWGIRKLWKLR